MAHPLLAPRPQRSGPTTPPGPSATTDDDGLVHTLGAGFSASERAAMIRDGLVRELLGPVCSPALAPVTRRERAEALRATLPESVLAAGVLHRTAAAWFLSCAPQPETLQIMVHRRRRTTMRPDLAGAGGVRWEVRQLVHEPQDVDRFHGVAVTTPVRTAADLACWDGPGSWEALLTLLGAPHLGVQPQDAVRLLRERTHLPGRRAGVMAVRRACRELGIPVPG